MHTSFLASTSCVYVPWVGPFIYLFILGGGVCYFVSVVHCSIWGWISPLKGDAVFMWMDYWGSLCARPSRDNSSRGFRGELVWAPSTNSIEHTYTQNHKHVHIRGDTLSGWQLSLYTQRPEEVIGVFLRKTEERDSKGRYPKWGVGIKQKLKLAELLREM